MLASLIAAIAILFALKTANDVMLRYIFPEDVIHPHPPLPPSSSDRPS